MPLFRRLANLIRRRRMADDLDAELRFHLEEEAAERREAGASQHEARREARLHFGNVGVIAEDTRATWGWTMCEQLAQDVAYAVRTLRKSPAFTATALLCLALGIGANTLLYGLTDAVLLRALPVNDPQRLVRMTWRTPERESHGISRHNSSFRDPAGGYTSGVFSYAAFELFQARREFFSNVFAYQSTGQISLGIGNETITAQGEYVSGDYFRALGVAPRAGRLLGEDDDRMGAPAVVMIRTALAESRFGSPDAAVGQTLLLNNTSFIVVGVTPTAFVGTDPGFTPDLYISLHAAFALAASRSQDEIRRRFEDPGEVWLEVMGRLSPGVTIERAQAALAAPFQQFTQQVKDSDRRWRQAPTLALVAGAQGIDGLRRGYATPLLLLTGLGSLILLLACSNIANLLLARSAARAREIAVRMSLGAARKRVIRQLLTESVVLSLTGGLLGVAVALLCGPLVVILLTQGQPNLEIHAGLNWRVLFVASSLSVLTGLVFGVLPAVRSTRQVLLGAVADARSTPVSSRRAGPARSIIVVQMGATLVLLVAAGLFARTLANFAAIDLGFNPQRVLTVTVNARQAGLDNAGAIATYRDLRSRLESISGVVSVGMSEWAIMGEGQSQTTVVPPGRQATDSVPVINAGAGFLETMEVPIVAGRTLEPGDERPGAKPVVVVAESYARTYFPDGNALGRTVRLPDDSPRVALIDFEVVGIARDARYGVLIADRQPTVYIPFSFAIFENIRQMMFEIRTTADPWSYERAVRQIVNETNSRMPITRIETQAGLIGRVISTPILLTRLCVTFAILALLIAVIGLYGSVAYDVSRRVPEIGVRIALGADPGRVVRMILGNVLVLAAIGVFLGAAGARAVSGYADAFLFGVSSNDVLTIASAAGVLLAAALLASYLPARAASRLNPTLALRNQ